jgi:hypothetical protein
MKSYFGLYSLARSAWLSGKFLKATPGTVTIDLEEVMTSKAS